MRDLLPMLRLNVVVFSPLMRNHNSQYQSSLLVRCRLFEHISIAFSWLLLLLQSTPDISWHFTIITLGFKSLHFKLLSFLRKFTIVVLNDTKKSNFLFYVYSLLKYKRMKFVVNQTITSLVKLIEKNINTYSIKLASFNTL